MRGREKFQKYRRIISGITFAYSIFPQKIQNKLLVRHRKTPGYWGLVIRYSLLKNLAAHVGENVSVHPDVYLFNVSGLSIGDNVSIHPMTYIEAAGNVTIGNDVSIAHGVTIMSTNHSFSDPSIPIKDQKVTTKRVTIRDNVWIASKAVILAGVTVDTGCVIAAGAVVTKDTLPNKVYAGLPAKVLKDR